MRRVQQLWTEVRNTGSDAGFSVFEVQPWHFSAWCDPYITWDLIFLMWKIGIMMIVMGFTWADVGYSEGS